MEYQLGTSISHLSLAMGKKNKISINLDSSRLKYTYTKEKISQAVHELAIGEGDVRYRLTKAYLCFHILTTKDFPEDLRLEWQDFLKQLNKKGPYKARDGRVMLNSVQNTMRHIRNSTASRLASQLMAINYKLEHYI